MADVFLKLRSFGVTTLSDSVGNNFVGLGAKALGLLVFVAARAPTAVSREELVELFWERADPAMGRGSLRQALRRIKKTIGAERFAQALEVNDRFVALRPGAVEVDIDLLEALASETDADKLAVLLDYCQGDFLADNAARAVAFQDWAAERRSYYQDLIIGAMSRLGSADLGANKPERARKAAEKIIAIDPLHEQAHEIIIRTLLASGSRGQARNHYERFRREVLTELGAEPGFQLSDLDTPDGPRITVAEAEDSPNKKSQPVIAVMNVSRGDNQEQEILAAGVVEELVLNMSRSVWIKVAGLDHFKIPREGELDLAARNLRGNADYILRVKVLIAGQRASIIATLNRLSDNATVFSDKMEESIEDVLRLQRRTATRISSIFEGEIVRDQTERNQAELENNAQSEVDPNHFRMMVQAHSLVLRQGPTDGQQARKIIARALELKPDDTPALCMMAFSHVLDASNGWAADTAEAIEQAQVIAGQAVQGSPNSSWAHYTLGMALGTHDQLDAAAARIEHSLTLNPSLIIAQGDLARLRVFQGQHADAVDQANQALENSPYHLNTGLWIRVKAMVAWLEGDLKEALSLIDYAIIVRNMWFQNHFLRAVILAEMGRIDEGTIAFISGEATNPNYPDAAQRYRHPFADRETYARFIRGLNKVGGRFQE